MYFEQVQIVARWSNIVFVTINATSLMVDI